MKKRGLVLASFLFFVTAFDASALEARRDPNDSATTWIRSGDEGRYTLDRVGLDADGWPKILSHEVFASAAESARAARRAGFFGMPSAGLYLRREADARELRIPDVDPLWKVTNAWSADWETKYSEWIEKNVDREFFVRTKQASDCADLAYTARWIFAREHGLPMANRLAGTGDFFTERSVKREWASLPTDPDWTKDRRFRAALDYLLSLTYTHSLMGDSYPVALDPTTFRAGTHHLSLTDDTGHTLLIHRTDYANPSTLPFLVLYSTLPVAVRQLAEQAYFYIEQPKPNLGGFLRMRWPVVGANGKIALKPAAEMPGYSLEQYDPKLMEDQSSFGLAVMRKLKPTFSLVLAMRSAIDGVKEMIRDRVKIVEDGFAACSALAGGCREGSKEYENWSTPSRDSRILAQTNLIQSMAALGNSDERKQMEALVVASMKETVFDLGGEPISLYLVYQAFRRGLHSTDPNRPIELRWGVRPEGLAALFKEKLVAGFAERKVKMASAGATCRGSTRLDCAPGESAYRRETTFAIDSKLKEPSLLVSVYCRAAGEKDAKCARLRALLASTKLAIDGETASLGEWIERALRLNSDPRVSLDLRNGKGKLPYASLELTGAHEFRLRGRLAFLRDRLTFRGALFERRGDRFEPRAFPNGLVLLDADLGANRGLFARGSRLVTADLAGAGESPVAEYAEAPVEARLLGTAANGRERVLVFGASEWRLLELVPNGTARELLRADFREKAALDPKFDREILAYHTSAEPLAGWALVDLRAANPVAMPFEGAPLADSQHVNFVFPSTLYLQVVQLGPNGEILRTLRGDRRRGTLELAWGLRSYVGHVTNDDRTAYFADKTGEVETFYEAPIAADGTLGPRTKLSSAFYRQADYVIFYGGIPAMLFRAIRPDGTLVPIATQPNEEWFKHVRGDSIFALLKDGNYGIRRVSGGGTFIEDGFLAMPRAGSGEDPYRFLVRHWKGDVVAHEEVPFAFTSLTDVRHPERFAVLTGMLLGDPVDDAHEPWSADAYAGVDAVDFDSGTVINLGARAYWIGD